EAPPVHNAGFRVATHARAADCMPRQVGAFGRRRVLDYLDRAGSVWHSDTTIPASTIATQSAGLNSTCSPTNSPLPGSYPICPLDRGPAGQCPLNAFLASANHCRL